MKALKKIANLAGKQKIILLYSTNCPSYSFFLCRGLLSFWQSFSMLTLFFKCREKAVKIRVVEITLQSTFVHIYQSFQTFNITALEYTKYFDGEN